VTPLLITPYDLFYGTSNKYHIDTLYRVLFLLRNLFAVVECFRCHSEVPSQDVRLFLGSLAHRCRTVIVQFVFSTVCSSVCPSAWSGATPRG